MRLILIALLTTPLFAAAGQASIDDQDEKFADVMMTCDAQNIMYAMASGDGGLAEGSKPYSQRYLAAAAAAAGDDYVSKRTETIRKDITASFLSRLSTDQTFSLMTDWQTTLRSCNDKLENRIQRSRESQRRSQSLSSNNSFKPNPHLYSAQMCCCSIAITYRFARCGSA